ncbi:MAG: carbohydrate kinase family protein, partial [Bryobacteraceae bacterium]
RPPALDIGAHASLIYCIVNCNDIYRTITRSPNFLRILLVGEINFDVVLKGHHAVPVPGREILVEDFTMTLGSSCAITAAGLVRLGNEASYVGKTGDDPGGRLCLEKMVALGLDISRVKLDPALKTGVTVSITSSTDRSLISYLGATTALTASEVGSELFTGYRHLHTSSYFLQTGLHPGFADLFARATRHGLTTSLDPACDPAGEWKSGLDRVLREIDVFLPNEVELAGITGEKDPVRGLRALENGRTLTVVKLGARGAMALKNGVPVSVPAQEIEPLDLTGAGDCFNAGFLHAWLRGMELAEALRFGVACGSFSIRGLGGTGAQPTEKEAFDFMRQGISKT